MARLILVALIVALEICSYVTAATPQTIGEPILLRAKRQQCRCVRLAFTSGLQCGCQQPYATSQSNLLQEENAQREQLATELSSSTYPQASCACIQLVFQGNPQYQCHCGENGTPAVTTHTPGPVTVPTTQTTTTTEAPTTTTTTTTVTTTTTTTTTPTTTTTTEVVTINTTPAYVSQVPTGQPGNGQCHCIMIQISGPSSAQYQCSCLSTPAPAMDDHQETTTPSYATVPPQTAIPDTLPPITTTTRVETTPVSVTVPVTEAPIQTTPPQYYPSEETVPPTYPLTTTCVMYLTGVQSTPCMCMPEYDPCAQNICCLKARYRSLKHNGQSASLPLQNDAVSQNPSTLDMLMNVLQKIKNKWE